MILFENGYTYAVTNDEKGSIAIYPQYKTGKVTLTGTALDGSKKTVKITLNIVKESQGNTTESITLRTPAGTANGGIAGNAVVTWGKSVQLYTGFVPSASKNKTVEYTVQAVDENGNVTDSDLPGVTVKNGKLTVAKYSKTLTPYTGKVRVTAKLNYKIYDEALGLFKTVSASQDIYIQQPVTKLTVYNGTDVAKTVNVKRGETAALTAVAGFASDEKVKYDTVLWTVSNSLYASVNKDGEVTVKTTAPKGKTFKVTASSLDGSGKKATVTIKID